MRILALDVGDVRIGVAMTDANHIIAKPFEVIDRLKTKALNRIRDIVSEYNVELIVVGMPYSLDGTVKGQAEKVEVFAKKVFNKLEHKIPLEFVDERLTTVEAHTALYDSGVKDRREHKYLVDKVAAAIILEIYLQKLQNKEN